MVIKWNYSMLPRVCVCVYMRACICVCMCVCVRVWGSCEPRMLVEETSFSYLVNCILAPIQTPQMATLRKSNPKKFMSGIGKKRLHLPHALVKQQYNFMFTIILFV